MQSLENNQIFLGKYRIEEFLGEGGMGEAFRATDVGSGNDCVIKRAKGVDNFEQLIDEAKIMDEISQNYPNLPTLYEYGMGMVSGEKDETPYIVMEYIDGDTLEDKVKKGVYNLQDIIQWGVDILNTLKYIHSHGLIHRDIHPKNICITPDGQAILLDFGISRRLDVTHTRTIIAGVHNPSYAPIEQFVPGFQKMNSDFEEADIFLRALACGTEKYTDIYGLAATLYYALTKKPPMHPVKRIMKKDPALSRDSKFDVPSVLFDVVLNALEIDPADRYQTADDMLFAWQKLIIPRVNTVTVESHVFVPVSAGSFCMGSNEVVRSQRFSVDLPHYYISRYPVTNSDYKKFIDACPDWHVPTGSLRTHRPYAWDNRNRNYPSGLGNYPVVLVSWRDAQEYVRWLTRETGYSCRLLSEAEWEKAACWDVSTKQARKYPWGDIFDKDKCNTNYEKLMPIGYYSPRGNSPYGIVGMSGNIWEWTNTLEWPYPYKVGANREKFSRKGRRVIRGGAYNDLPQKALAAWRESAEQTKRASNIGFRVALDMIVD